MANNSSTASTTLCKRSQNHRRTRPSLVIRKMFQNRRKAKLAKQQRKQNQSANKQHDRFNDQIELLGHNQHQQEEQLQLEQPRKERFSIRRKNSMEMKKVRCESPPRRMPKEIKITPGTPDSIFSAVSGATGLHTTENNLPSGGRSMFKSVLPEMTSETEECSLDRSTFSWASKVGTNNNNSNSANGKGGKNATRTRSLEKSHKHSDSSRSMGGFMIGDSSRSLSSDDSDGPSKQLMFGSPSKGKAKEEQKSFLFRSKTFKNIVNYTFESIDIDKSGTIDKKEIYSGLLLIHLKLAAYVGPAACRPASKDHVFRMFDVLDIDGTGSLNKEDFTDLMTILCSDITTRVFMQLSMTLMIVPFISQYLVEVIKDSYHVLCIILAEIDDAEVVTEFVWGIIQRGWDFVLLLIPPIVQRGLGSLCEGLSESFLDTMPLTIMSCSLGCIIVPWLLYKCDEFYNSVAVTRSTIKRGY